MKHTEEQIAKIAIHVMNDIGWAYEKSVAPIPIEMPLEKQIERINTQKNHPRFQEYVDLLFPYWDVVFDFPKEDGWGERNMQWVLINDETGEPYEVGHRQWKGKIKKNADGKYEKQNY